MSGSPGIPVGHYRLAVGSPAGTLITPGTPEAQDTAPDELARELEAESKERRTVGERAEGVVVSASEATKRLERAEDLLTRALQGSLFDLDQLPARVSEICAVLERLDRDGRREEWLRYARAINGLLALAMRWADLVRSLGSFLRTAEKIPGAEAATAWAQHELGTLHLAAEDPAGAERLLARARDTRQELGDDAGLAVTEQSLSVLCRQQARGGRGEQRRRQVRRLLLALVGVLLLLIGGVAGAVVDPFDDAREVQLTAAVDGAGVVSTAAAEIRCPSRCEAEFDRGASVSLTASALPGAKFAGWSGDCTGSRRCRLTMDDARAATAHFASVPETRTVSVRKTGDGDGRVTSPSGIDCGSACRTSVERAARVRLDATPAAGSTFAGWSGACGGTGACRVTVRDSVTVVARFTAPVAPGRFVLTVAPAGAGSGLVTSDPPGISCGDDCRETFDERSEVDLRAKPDAGSVFSGWSGGGCSGAQACRVTLTEAQTVTAAFDPESPVEFTLTTSTEGSGRISPSCPSGCKRAQDEVIELTATPTGGANRVDWTGCAPSPDQASCEVTMSEDRKVSASFSFQEP